MSVSYWMNEGLGVEIADIIESIDAEKIYMYLKDAEAFEDFTEDEYEEWKQEFRQANNEQRLEMLTEFFSDSDSDLASLLANSDEERLLTYGNNGEGKCFLLYPPSYPWSRCGNDCTTESAARRHVLNVIKQFTYDYVSAAEIELYIDFICEVGIG